MTLTPELALAYLKELSADYRSGVILDAHGATLAGDEELARAWPAGEPGVYEGVAETGKVFAIRTRTHAILITTGPFALPRLSRHDLRKTLAGLGAESAQESAIQTIPHGSVTALLRAAY